MEILIFPSIYRKIVKIKDATPSCVKANVGWCSIYNGFSINKTSNLRRIYKVSFANNLKLLRKEKGITQEQLADMLEVSRQAVSKWESDNGYPETDKLLIIAKVLGVSLDYLMDNIEESSLSSDNMIEKDETIFECDGNVQQCVQIQKKLYIVDVNKRRLSAFDEFAIEMLSRSNQGEADLITGIKKSDTKVKVPVCILYGVTKGFLGMNKHVTLGYYASLEDAEKELNSISKASTTGTVYELKYAAKMQGVRIVNND